MKGEKRFFIPSTPNVGCHYSIEILSFSAAENKKIQGVFQRHSKVISQKIYF